MNISVVTFRENIRMISEAVIQSGVTSRWETKRVKVFISTRLKRGKWFEPRSVSCLSSVIVRVKVVFRKTVTKNRLLSAGRSH